MFRVHFFFVGYVWYTAWEACLFDKEVVILPFTSTFKPPQTATSPLGPPLYNGHLSTTATYLQWPPLHYSHLSTVAIFFGGQSVHSFLFQPLYKGCLSATVTSPLQPPLHNVLSTHFYVSPNLGAVPTVWIWINFVTQHLKTNLSVFFTHLSQGTCCIKAYHNLFYVFGFLPCSFIHVKIFSWFSEMPFPTDASNWKKKYIYIYNLIYYMLLYFIENWIIG